MYQKITHNLINTQLSWQEHSCHGNIFIEFSIHRCVRPVRENQTLLGDVWSEVNQDWHHSVSFGTHTWCYFSVVSNQTHEVILWSNVTQSNTDTLMSEIKHTHTDCVLLCVCWWSAAVDVLTSGVITTGSDVWTFQLILLWHSSWTDPEPVI